MYKASRPLSQFGTFMKKLAQLQTFTRDQVREASVAAVLQFNFSFWVPYSPHSITDVVPENIPYQWPACESPLQNSLSEEPNNYWKLEQSWKADVKGVLNLHHFSITGNENAITGIDGIMIVLGIDSSIEAINIFFLLVN